jgi:hypothetical protein
VSSLPLLLLLLLLLPLLLAHLHTATHAQPSQLPLLPSTHAQPSQLPLLPSTRLLLLVLCTERRMQASNADKHPATTQLTTLPMQTPLFSRTTVRTTVTAASHGVLLLLLLLLKLLCCRWCCWLVLLPHLLPASQPQPHQVSLERITLSRLPIQAPTLQGTTQRGRRPA